MGEWKRIKLSEVLKEKTERNKNNETDLVLSVTNSQGFVKQSDFFEGTVHSEDISNYKLVKKNEFAYNPSRINVGSIDILKEYDIGALSPMYVIFSVDETKLLPDYFKHYFQTHKFNENVKNNTQGSVRNSLSFKALSEFEYLLPPLEEQKRIVKILDQVNRIIEKYQNLISEKEQFIKSQFVEMFEEDINVQKTTVNNVADIYLGLTYTPKYTETGIPFLSSKNISSQKLDLEDIKYISQEEYENATNNAKPINGDILFSRVGSNLGNPTIFETNIKCAIFVSLGYLRIKNTNEFDNIFVRDWMKSDNFWHQVFNKVSGGAKQNLNTNWLRNFEIPNPSLEKQNEYKSLVQLIDKQKFNYINKIKLLNKIINIFLGGKKI